MRPLPLLLVALAVAAGTALGLRVMWGGSTGTAAVGTTAGERVHYLGGLPQGHVYSGALPETPDVNPFTAHDGVAKGFVLAHTHDGLLDVDPTTGALRPALAERFEVAADGTACTFTLREGVKFADGRLLAMDDVLFGWELARAGHLPLGFTGDAYARVRDVEVVDDRTLRVHFRDTHFAALRVIGENWLVAQKQWFVDRVAARCEAGTPPAIDTEQFATLLGQIDLECGPGTGAYVLHNDPSGASNWRPRDQLLLVRNEHSWRRAVHPGTWNFGGLRLLWRDQTGAQNALLRGEVDWFSSSMAKELFDTRPALQHDYRRLVYDRENLGVFRVMWDCSRPPCDDVRVRKALGMLFDSERVLPMFEGRGRRAVAHAWPGSKSYPTDVEPLPYDPSAARRLLREAGFDPEQGKPLHLVLLAVTGNDVMQRIVEQFVDAARQSGIDLDLRARDQTTFVAEKKKREWHGLLGLQSFRATGDPYDFLHSEGVDNDGGFANAEIDRLAVEARGELDADRRAALWRELHTIAWREQPAALLVHPVVSMLLHKRVQGVETGPLGLVLERAWVAADDQRP